MSLSRQLISPHILGRNGFPEAAVATTKTDLPSMRPFTLEECEALVAGGIIADDEQASVLAGTHLFSVDEFFDMVRAGVLQKEDRVELIDGKVITMPPIGDSHQSGTDWLTMLLVPNLAGRAMVRIQGSIRLHMRSAPEPDVAVLRLRSIDDNRPYFPEDIHFLIEVADSSLSYDTGAKLARYAAAGIPEVWVANLRVREVTVYADPSGSDYATVATYRPGDTVSPRAFPDVSLAVDDFMPPATHGHDAQ